MQMSDWCSDVDSSDLDDEYVDPGARLRQRMIARAYQRRDRHIVPFAEVEHQLRRHAERVGDQPDRMAEGDLEQLRGAVLAHILAKALARRHPFVEAGGVDAVDRKSVL